MRLEVREQARAIGLELEVVVRLAGMDHLAEDFRPLAVDLVLLRHELLLSHAVVALVLLKDDLAPVVKLLQPLAHHLLVLRIRRAHEGGRLHAQAAVEFAEPLAHAVGERLRLDVLALRRLLHLLPVLVHAGEEKDLLVEAGLVPREEVGQHLFVGVAQVRRAVHIVDRRREKIRTGHAKRLRRAPRKASRLFRRPWPTRPTTFPAQTA